MTPSKRMSPGFACIAAVLVAATGLSACATSGLSEAGLAGPAAPRRVQTPAVNSGEYKRSWGLQVVNAYPAYAAGATGRGVMIALVDVGLEGARPEVAANVSPLSTDLMTARNPEFRPSRHGDYVAGTLASALNGGGTVGVAYEATILSIRAELDGRCRISVCTLAAGDLARGVDYAVANGAKVIALALQGERRLTPAFEAALGRAAAAGAVVVVAAGNEAAADPSWPARYAADPRFAGSVLVVGAVDARAGIARWSNRAGRTMENYLVAPGQNIVTDCDTQYCTLVSGTSFAVPFVAGAVALMLQVHPEMSGREAAAAVLRGARDLGQKGPDPVYGQGLLDIGHAIRLALQPAPKPF